MLLLASRPDLKPQDARLRMIPAQALAKFVRKPTIQDCPTTLVKQATL